MLYGHLGSCRPCWLGGVEAHEQGQHLLPGDGRVEATGREVGQGEGRHGGCPWLPAVKVPLLEGAEKLCACRQQREAKHLTTHEGHAGACMG